MLISPDSVRILLTRIFSGEPKSTIEAGLKRLLRDTPVRMVPEASALDFAAFLNAYRCDEQRIREIATPCLGTRLGRIECVEPGLFDSRLTCFLRLPKVQVVVAPELPAPFLELEERHDLESELAMALFDGFLHYRGFPQHSHRQAGTLEQLRTVCGRLYDAFERFAASCVGRPLATVESPADAWATYLARLAEIYGLELEVVDQAAILRASADRDQLPELFSGKACTNDRRSWFLPAIRFGSETALPARGCLVPEIIPSVYRLLRKIADGEPGTREVALASKLVAETEQRFLKVDGLPLGDTFHQLLDEVSRPEALILALAKDIGAELVGVAAAGRPAILPPDHPVFRQATESIRPRICPSGTLLGEVIHKARAGLRQGDDLVLRPEIDVCVLDSFPERLGKAFRWYERVCQGETSFSFDHLIETDRCFRLALWQESDFPSADNCEGTPFLEACSRMLQEIAQWHEGFDRDLEQAVGNLIGELASNYMVPSVPTNADVRSTAILLDSGSSDPPDDSWIWLYPDDTTCRWRLPGFRAVGRRRAIRAVYRREIRVPHPVWKRTLKLVRAVTDTAFRARLQKQVFSLYEEVGNRLTAEETGRLLEEVFDPIQKREIRDAISLRVPTALDDYLEFLEQQTFPDHGIETLTRHRWVGQELEDSHGFELGVRRVDSDRPGGELLGLGERGVRIAGSQRPILRPVVFRSRGTSCLELLYLYALRPLADSSSRVSKLWARASRLIDGFESDPQEFLLDQEQALFLRTFLLVVANRLVGSRKTRPETSRPDHFYVLYLHMLADLRNDLDDHGGKLELSWGRQEILVRAKGEDIVISVKPNNLRGDRRIFHTSSTIEGSQTRKLTKSLLKTLREGSPPRSVAPAPRFIQSGVSR